MDDDDKVVDAEIVEDSAQSLDDAATFLNLEELIKNHIESIAKLRQELKQQKEMYEDSFNNDPIYKEHSDKVKEVTKAKSSVKKQISSQPSVAMLGEKVKDLRIEITEKNKTLSDLLADYKEQTGATQIETKSGQILELVSTIKLVKPNSK